MIHRGNGHTARGNSIAKPIIKRMHWPYPIVWIVPLVAAIGTGFYFRDYLLNRGPKVTITFNDGSGLKDEETKVLFRGVVVGEVAGIELSGDHSQVMVHVRLQKHQDVFAQQGALYWVVRPEISFGGISGLNTVLSGPYIEATPGNGAVTTDFAGLQKPPSALGPGLHVVLHAPHMEHLQPESAVYYRGIQVGTVQSIGLNSNADGIDIRVFVQHRYEPLVRTNSQFWLLNGLDIKAGLLSGVQMKLDSLRSLISGGVTFNSPDDKMGPPAPDGLDFALYDEPKKEWQAWSPKIPVGPDDSEAAAQQSQTPSGPQALNNAIKGK